MKVSIVLFLVAGIACISVAEDIHYGIKHSGSEGHGQDNKGGKSTDQHLEVSSGKSSKHDQELVKKGQDFKDIHKTSHVEKKGKKSSHLREDSHKSAKHAAGGSHHGLKYADGKKNKKANYLKGFREKFHKDEEKKHDSFFSNGQKSGEYEVYGKKNAKYSSDSFNKKNKKNHKNSAAAKSGGKAYKSAKGHADSAHKSHQGKGGSQSHRKSSESHGKKSATHGGKTYKGILLKSKTLIKKNLKTGVTQRGKRIYLTTKAHNNEIIHGVTETSQRVNIAHGKTKKQNVTTPSTWNNDINLGHVKSNHTTNETIKVEQSTETIAVLQKNGTINSEKHEGDQNIVNTSTIKPNQTESTVYTKAKDQLDENVNTPSSLTNVTNNGSRFVQNQNVQLRRNLHKENETKIGVTTRSSKKNQTTRKKKKLKQIVPLKKKKKSGVKQNEKFNYSPQVLKSGISPELDKDQSFDNIRERIKRKEDQKVFINNKNKNNTEHMLTSELTTIGQNFSNKQKDQNKDGNIYTNNENDKLTEHQYSTHENSNKPIFELDKIAKSFDNYYLQEESKPQFDTTTKLTTIDQYFNNILKDQNKENHFGNVSTFGVSSEFSKKSDKKRKRKQKLQINSGVKKNNKSNYTLQDNDTDNKQNKYSLKDHRNKSKFKNSSELSKKLQKFNNTNIKKTKKKRNQKQKLRQKNVQKSGVKINKEQNKENSGNNNHKYSSQINSKENFRNKPKFNITSELSKTINNKKLKQSKKLEQQIKNQQNVSDIINNRFIYSQPYFKSGFKFITTSDLPIIDQHFYSINDPNGKERNSTNKHKYFLLGESKIYWINGSKFGVSSDFNQTERNFNPNNEEHKENNKDQNFNRESMINTTKNSLPNNSEASVRNEVKFDNKKIGYEHNLEDNTEANFGKKLSSEITKKNNTAIRNSKKQRRRKQDNNRRYYVDRIGLNNTVIWRSKPKQDSHLNKRKKTDNKKRKIKTDKKMEKENNNPNNYSLQEEFNPTENQNSVNEKGKQYLKNSGEEQNYSSQENNDAHLKKESKLGMNSELGNINRNVHVPRNSRRKVKRRKESKMINSTNSNVKKNDSLTKEFKSNLNTINQQNVNEEERLYLNNSTEEQNYSSQKNNDAHLKKQSKLGINSELGNINRNVHVPRNSKRKLKRRKESKMINSTNSNVKKNEDSLTKEFKSNLNTINQQSVNEEEKLYLNNSGEEQSYSNSTLGNINQNVPKTSRKLKSRKDSNSTNSNGEEFKSDSNTINQHSVIDDEEKLYLNNSREKQNEDLKESKVGKRYKLIRRSRKNKKRKKKNRFNNKQNISLENNLGVTEKPHIRNEVTISELNQEQDEKNTGHKPIKSELTRKDLNYDSNKQSKNRKRKQEVNNSTPNTDLNENNESNYSSLEESEPYVKNTTYKITKEKEQIKKHINRKIIRKRIKKRKRKEDPNINKTNLEHETSSELTTMDKNLNTIRNPYEEFHPISSTENVLKFGINSELSKKNNTIINRLRKQEERKNEFKPNTGYKSKDQNFRNKVKFGTTSKPTKLNGRLQKQNVNRKVKKSKVIKKNKKQNYLAIEEKPKQEKNMVQKKSVKSTVKPKAKTNEKVDYFISSRIYDFPEAF